MAERPREDVEVGASRRRAPRQFEARRAGLDIASLPNSFSTRESANQSSGAYVLA